MVCGLLGLQRAFGALALIDEIGQNRPVILDVLNDLRLDLHGLPISAHHVLPALLCGNGLIVCQLNGCVLCHELHRCGPALLQPRQLLSTGTLSRKCSGAGLNGLFEQGGCMLCNVFLLQCCEYGQFNVDGSG